MKLTVNQERLLSALLDKYENSKTYEGSNLVNQSFAIGPFAIFADYDSDYANVGQVRDFETEMRCLEDMGLIEISYQHGVIKKLVACNDNLKDYYDYLKRRPKKDLILEQLDFFNKWVNCDNNVIAMLCQDEVSRLESGKKSVYPYELYDNLLKILSFVMSNKEEILERELSILLLSDSKAFEKKYRSKVCKILNDYIDFADWLEGIDDTREREKIILEEFMVYSNPTYVYLKGDAALMLKDGSTINVGDAPIGISSELIKDIARIVVNSKKVVTVENMTSFHRIKGEDCTYIYLAGYHNTEKQRLLKRIDKENPNKKWFHFGDIDPDGYYILEHLRRGTGIDLQPLNMGTDMLKQYFAYCKELNKNDKMKAKNLLDSKKHTQVMQYMLDNNCKLEQEIVSFVGVGV